MNYGFRDTGHLDGAAEQRLLQQQTGCGQMRHGLGEHEDPQGTGGDPLHIRSRGEGTVNRGFFPWMRLARLPPSPPRTQAAVICSPSLSHLYTDLGTFLPTCSLHPHSHPGTWPEQGLCSIVSPGRNLRQNKLGTQSAKRSLRCTLLALTGGRGGKRASLVSNTPTLSLPLPLPGSATWGNLPHLAEPQLPHL